MELSDSDVLNDWSGTGRGRHVDLSVDEAVALQTGDLLGQGADAIVHETTVQGLKVAWKRTSRHRKSIANVRLEIEVLKKLSHRHLVRLIGSYTHKRSVGLLLYPVAVCDLGTFFEDAEAYLQDNAADDQELRLRQLGYSSGPSLKHKAWPIYSQIGCLLSAVAYLHSQSIRHKDIKPSNILLSRGRLWLSDFGLARDFSNFSDSGTDGGAGTVRYKAPEVADFERSGRASDMFSLGCVLLEAMVFDQDGTLQRLRPESPTTRFVYHENQDKLNDWLPWPEDLNPIKHHLCLAIRSLLSGFPKQRPGADELVSRISLCDNMMEHAQDRIFSDCCRISYFTEQQFESRIKALQIQILSLRREKQIEQQIIQTDRRLNDLEDQDWIDTYYERLARQWMEEKIDKAWKALRKTKIFILLKSSTTAKAEPQNVIYYSPGRFEKLVGIIITCIIFVVLVLPVVAMYMITSITDRTTFSAIGTLVVFTLLFSAAMSLLTKVKRHELFALCAAYCAVLVMFIAHFDNPGWNGHSYRALSDHDSNRLLLPHDIHPHMPDYPGFV